jgi:hypothetical protein
MEHTLGLGLLDREVSYVCSLLKLAHRFIGLYSAFRIHYSYRKASTGLR